MQIRQWLQDINSSLVCAAIDRPARACSAVIKAGKPQGCLPASFDFERRSVAEIGLEFEANFGKDLQSPEPLQSLGFL